MLRHLRPPGAAMIAAAIAVALALLLASVPHARGGEADVVTVQVSRDGTSPGGTPTYRFDVTVAHADTGWDHYADAWEVRGPDGRVLGIRELAHPHVNEQPFTRSLSGVGIPDGMTPVTVCAHDSVHEFGGICIDVDVDVE